ncbi:MAG TPA: hypothetical protein VEB40_03470 [Flavipsychrobacter sp.]|nr:hypothetical protein [Flavipsychrobacter sp.]
MTLSKFTLICFAIVSASSLTSCRKEKLSPNCTGNKVVVLDEVKGSGKNVHISWTTCKDHYLRFYLDRTLLDKNGDSIAQYPTIELPEETYTYIDTTHVGSAKIKYSLHCYLNGEKHFSNAVTGQGKGFTRLGYFYDPDFIESPATGQIILHDGLNNNILIYNYLTGQTANLNFSVYHRAALQVDQYQNKTEWLLMDNAGMKLYIIDVSAAAVIDSIAIPSSIFLIGSGNSEICLISSNKVYSVNRQSKTVNLSLTDLNDYPLLEAYAKKGHGGSFFLHSTLGRKVNINQATGQVISVQPVVNPTGDDMSMGTFCDIENTPLLIKGLFGKVCNYETMIEVGGLNTGNEDQYSDFYFDVASQTIFAVSQHKNQVYLFDKDFNYKRTITTSTVPYKVIASGSKLIVFLYGTAFNGLSHQGDIYVEEIDLN